MVKTAMILAAGLGTRLSPLTNERPKPLVEVLGTPLVHFALEHARRAGARRVALNSHHLHPALQEHLGERYSDLELVYSHEPVILGTGGGAREMRAALGDLEGPTLLLNADALLDIDTAAMARLHEERRPLATLALKDAPDKARYGLLGTDDDDRVRTFVGRTAYEGPLKQERMFCGVHVLEGALLDALPAEGFACINKEGYPKLLDAGAVVVGFDVPGYFCDVGTPERLLEANLLLLSGQERLSHADPFARFTKRGDAYVHPSAEISDSAVLTGPVLVDEGAVLEAGARVGPLAVIGKGCVLGAGASVSRAVLQSGARVAAGEVVTDVILSPTTRMPVDPAVAAAVAGSPVPVSSAPAVR